MTRFKVIDLPLAGLKIIERISCQDDRGFLSRLFCIDNLAILGWQYPVAQVNHSRTRFLGSIRGMHYQDLPYCDAKLVTCIRGEVWDVAVDLRQDSPTFLRSYGQLLSEHNCRSALIPPGFAHGFQTCADNCELIYLHSTMYQPQADKGLRYNDPKLEISWPHLVTLVSHRDKSHPLLTSSFKGIKL